MIRRQLCLACQGAEIAATLDLPEGCDEQDGATAGLLIVSGGNEIRSGAGGAHARLAARIAAAGYAVLRFDRRGIGDSEGANAGFRGAGPDIASALQALREAAKINRVVAFGNCDGASALMLLAGKSAENGGVDALVLANPWTLEGEDAANLPVHALRAHYRRRLVTPGALWRLLTGRVSLRRLASGLAGAARPPAGPSELARAMADGVAAFNGPVRILLAGRDRTADAFFGSWDRADPRIRHCPDAGHGFLETTAQDWLAAQLIEALAEAARA